MPAKGQAPYRGGDRSEQIEAKSLIDSKLKGTLAETYVALALTERGYDVYVPFSSNHKSSDIAVLKDGRLLLIQVKYAGYEIGGDRYRAQLTTRDKHGNHISYQDREVDFFVVKVEGRDDYYVIPGRVGVNFHNVNVYPHRDKQIQGDAGVEWEEYRNAWSLIDAW